MRLRKSQAPSTSPAAVAPTSATDWAARRRALVRQHHPDRGGSAESLQAELARLEAERQAEEFRLTHPLQRERPARRLARRILKRRRYTQI